MGESEFPALFSLKHSREEDLTDGVKKVVQSKEIESFLELFEKELNNNPSLASRNDIASLGFTLWNDRLKFARLVKLNMIRKNVFFPNSEMATYPTAFTIANYGKENLIYKRYRFDPMIDVTVFDSSCGLYLTETQTMEPGDVFTFNSPNEVIEFDEATKNEPTILFIDNLMRTKPLVWLFDRKTKMPQKVVSADHNASQTEVFLALLTETNFTAGATAVQAIFKESKHHFVRWSAIKCLLRINPDMGISALKEAINDPHPHVRNSSKTTIDNFKRQGIIG